ncbi:sulfotransferase family 2 domain-containing protein [Sphingomonas sp.]|uniref:sulfotransferase family 2 domain-containing protein n=1 Tax=Sphingomonas sp. TaxID=28214 RepID=UPI0025EBA14C|nr:sulfotransferase family 2 domain-containing protein [Sphingomonas sp.]
MRHWRAVPIPKLPLRLLGLSDVYHRWWWQRTIARRSVLTDWNEKHVAIFVHIPKTAGTSILAALGAEPVFDTHAPARAYARAYPEFYRRAYKFAFVRNPWDRFASSFHFMKHGTEWPMQQEWARRHIGTMDFAEFTLRLRNPLFRATVLSERFFWAQTIWLGGLGNAGGVDQIFRFEEIDAATSALCARFALPTPATTPHLRQGAKADFRRLYNGPMIDVVTKLYGPDIAALGYRYPE